MRKRTDLSISKGSFVRYNYYHARNLCRESYLLYSSSSFSEKIAYVFCDAFLMAALGEETFKLLPVYILVCKNPNFNEQFDGIVYAVFVSLGFALAENIMYVFLNEINAGIAKVFAAIPAHAMFGIMMGYYLGLAKFSKKTYSY
ncbi:PrsW family glutamic-type intramembrane protease [Marinifilum sp. RC60d5]|uniref:PrsW family glutamic-type intramembrane protease n=1 Tax=Marinifilum sp. RC60d5 TaxID=3458414 RepID=UPI0040357220